MNENKYNHFKNCPVFWSYSLDFFVFCNMVISPNFILLHGYLGTFKKKKTLADLN